MPKAYGTLLEAAEHSGLSRTALYEALKRRAISGRKAGRRTLISFSDLESYIESLPAYRSEA